MLLSWILVLTGTLVLPLRALGTIEQKRVKLGESVVLKCSISLHHEIFWLRVNMKERPKVVLVARLKNDGGITEVLNHNSTHFEGCLVDKFFGLKIFSVLNSDLGSYYCGIVEGKRMEFEDGVHIYDIRDECVCNNKEAFSIQPPVAEKINISYAVFAAVLSVGLLAMVLVVFIVHMLICRKIN
ncbi:novel immune-type receptor 14 isoform X1 [Ictalurus punctatus]|uniref:Novel immune-type receptor 14 isoform X1 n=1 Tax=Ictalurus punctatus TaxID=7998 RepID=A0A2D0QIA3_ICTPU|nr:novel immune-type receptor 14 isoform X1 [Ictalurus punctatus]